MESLNNAIEFSRLTAWSEGIVSMLNPSGLTIPVVPGSVSKSYESTYSGSSTSAGPGLASMVYP